MKKRKPILDQEFWSNFARRDWEKRPCAVAGASSPVFDIGPEQIFEMLLAYSDRCRKIKNTAGLKFYIDGERISLQDHLEVLPNKKDKTLLGYHARLERFLADYCLVCDEFLQVGHQHWQTLGQFAKSLFRNVGFPNRFAEIGFYMGNYRKTPFGVHVDGCGVFSFPVIGEKTFRLWKPSYVARNPDLKNAHSYTKHKRNSSLLRAARGDMTYWPSSYWHIAESTGQFSATWSIGVWVDEPLIETALQALGPLYTQRLGESAQLPSTDWQAFPGPAGELGVLPASLREMISELGRISESERLDALTKLWLQKLSKNGFKSAPLPDDKLSLKNSGSLTLCRSAETQAILWKQLASRRICIACNGYLVEEPSASSLIRLLKLLNNGGSVRLKDFIQHKSLLFALMRVRGVIAHF
jgi:hypothetical protein